MLPWIEDQVEKAVAAYYRLRNFGLHEKAPLAACGIIAHRGNHSATAIENTVASFQKCLDEGVWGIEFDIRWTKDDVPVVHHDPSAARVFNNPAFIHELNFAELRSLLPEIPSLQEVVELFGEKMHLMIELKEPAAINDRQQGILRETLSTLKAGSDYHLMSLDLPDFAKLDFPNEIKIGIAILNVKEVSRFVLKHNWKAFTGPYFLISDKTVEKHRRANQLVGTGFIPNRSALCREINRGVCWFYTNEAADLQREFRAL